MKYYVGIDLVHSWRHSWDSRLQLSGNRVPFSCAMNAANGLVKPKRGKRTFSDAQMILRKGRSQTYRDNNKRSKKASASTIKNLSDQYKILEETLAEQTAETAACHERIRILEESMVVETPVTQVYGMRICGFSLIPDVANQKHNFLKDGPPGQIIHEFMKAFTCLSLLKWYASDYYVDNVRVPIELIKGWILYCDGEWDINTCGGRGILCALFGQTKLGKAYAILDNPVIKLTSKAQPGRTNLPEFRRYGDFVLEGEGYVIEDPPILPHPFCGGTGHLIGEIPDATPRTLLFEAATSMLTTYKTSGKVFTTYHLPKVNQSFNGWIDQHGGIRGALSQLNMLDKKRDKKRAADSSAKKKKDKY